jgi:hypothetical protein
MATHRALRPPALAPQLLGSQATQKEKMITWVFQQNRLLRRNPNGPYLSPKVFLLRDLRR